MKCPLCGKAENRVVDSRVCKDGIAIRRRRECLACEGRFTTYEFVEKVLPVVIKKDGRREPFDRTKILNGIKKACEKRPISIDTIESIVESIEQVCQNSYGKEIPSSVIGEKVMEELQKLDGVAYVRFASVYREFRDVSEFLKELKTFMSANKASSKQ